MTTSDPAVQALRTAYSQQIAVVRAAARLLGIPPNLLDEVALQAFVMAHSRGEELSAQEPARARMTALTRRVTEWFREELPPGAGDAPLAVTGGSVLTHFLAGLSEPAREVFVLSEVGGLKVPEISAELGISFDTARGVVVEVVRDFATAAARGGAEEVLHDLVEAMRPTPAELEQQLAALTARLMPQAAPPPPPPAPTPEPPRAQWVVPSILRGTGLLEEAPEEPAPASATPTVITGGPGGRLPPRPPMAQGTGAPGQVAGGGVLGALGLPPAAGAGAGALGSPGAPAGPPAPPLPPVGGMVQGTGPAGQGAPVGPPAGPWGQASGGVAPGTGPMGQAPVAAPGTGPWGQVPPGAPVQAPMPMPAAPPPPPVAPAGPWGQAGVPGVPIAVAPAQVPSGTGPARQTGPRSIVADLEVPERDLDERPARLVSRPFALIFVSLLVLGVAGGGGFLVWHQLQPEPEPEPTVEPAPEPEPPPPPPVPEEEPPPLGPEPPPTPAVPSTPTPTSKKSERPPRGEKTGTKGEDGGGSSKTGGGTRPSGGGGTKPEPEEPTPKRGGGGGGGGGKPDANDPGRVLVELEYLSAIDKALKAGNWAQALAYVEQHDRELPGGQLIDKFDERRIRALCGMGRGAEAKTKADQILAKRPTSKVKTALAESCK